MLTQFLEKRGFKKGSLKWMSQVCITVYTEEGVDEIGKEEVF